MATNHPELGAEPSDEEMQNCRSEEGITVGLVDAVIGIVRVLAPRDLRAVNVQEALADLFEDRDFQTIQNANERTGVTDR
ncbi:hypothetical protein AB0D49_08280 [Streptomyces sp. NPDC048290]|uniref:hypothetical protein n=1 Tax=Streptomyces sp. NPDC048290 TaxID=3155811 RepID=UPI0034200664